MPFVVKSLNETTRTVFVGATMSRVRFVQKTIGSIEGIDLDDDCDPGPIYYVLTQCPRKKCRSTHVPVDHTEGKIRYHKCSKCGKNFKSVLYPLLEPEQ